MATSKDDGTTQGNGGQDWTRSRQRLSTMLLNTVMKMLMMVIIMRMMMMMVVMMVMTMVMVMALVKGR